MNVQSLRRWHWVLAGLVVGLSLGYAHSRSAGSSAGTPRRPTLSPASFEQALLAPPFGGHPVLKDVTVVPDGGADYYVTMRMLVPAGKPGERVYREREFRPAGAANRPARPTVLEYVKDLAARNPQVRWRYGWWKTPAATVGLWTLGSVVLIGGVWPTVVNLLVGAGYGRPEPHYDLDRFRSEPPPPREGLTADEEGRLRELEEEMLQRLTQSADAPPPHPPPQPVRTAPVPVLNNLPEEATQLVPSDSECKDYKGEFYPVARPPGKRAPEGH